MGMKQCSSDWLLELKGKPVKTLALDRNIYPIQNWISLFYSFVFFSFSLTPNGI